MLELKNVSKSYDGKTVLGPIDLTIKSGTTTVLIGPSGCGKSTILRLLIGLLTPDAGTVHVDGVSLSADNLLEIRRRMGYVIQEGGLFPHLTCAANASLMARRLQWTADRINQRLSYLTELTHLPAAALDRFPQQLSGGQRQRVALIRALFLEPEFLLLDEPLGALDPMVRFDLQGELKEIFQKMGNTVILVTHDLNEAAFFADEIVLLRGGSIVQTGTFDQMLANPANDFVNQFIAAQRGILGTA